MNTGLLRLALSSLAFIAITAQAQPTVEPIKMTRCLADKMPLSYAVIAQNAQYKVINVPVAKMDALARLADAHDCGRFVNLGPKVQKTPALFSDNPQAFLTTKATLMPRLTSENYRITEQARVNKALSLIEPSNIRDTLSHLVAYHNRSAHSQTGVEAIHWVKHQFDALVTRYGRKDADSYFVETGWYKQPSLVTVLGKDKKGPGIVIGAHIDTLDGRMPGAGDDGSGSSSVMEVARVLMASEFEPTRPLYIIWYAAEERGLVGSEYVVDDFQMKNIAVKAAIQFDMTGFRNDQNDRSMWLYKDYTDKALTAFNAALIDTYIKVPVRYSSCGYGCSDHASWMEVGVPAVFPCETDFEHHNPYIHSSSDTMDLLSLDHMTNFTRLGVAFAIELAGK